MLTVFSMNVVMLSVVASRPGAYTKTFFYSELILYHDKPERLPLFITYTLVLYLWTIL
jgi:hypothetical protein